MGGAVDRKGQRAHFVVQKAFLWLFGGRESCEMSACWEFLQKSSECLSAQVC